MYMMGSFEQARDDESLNFMNKNFTMAIHTFVTQREIQFKRNKREKKKKKTVSFGKLAKSNNHIQLVHCQDD